MCSNPREPPTKRRSSIEQVKVRSAKEGDLEALYALDQRCFLPGIAYSKAELWHFFSHPRSVSFVIEGDGGRIAAFAIAGSYLNRGRLTGHLITIDVDPEMRREGLGHLLMEAIEESLRSNGAVSIKLEVAVDNVGAQMLYSRHGYEQTGRIPGFYNGRLDAFVMEKTLEAGNRD